METAATEDGRFAVGAISISHVFAQPTFLVNHDRRYGNRRYGGCSFRRRCDFHIARLRSAHILSVEHDYANLRQVGRTVFPDPVADRDARLNLALDQPIPGTIMLFIDKGLGVLAKAKQEPQAARLAAAGFDEERIDELIALFNALDLLYAARRQARQAAKDATVARDATVAEVRTAVRQLRLEVAAILRAHPEVNPPADF